MIAERLREWEELLQELPAGLAKEVQVLGEELVDRPVVAPKTL